MRQFSARRLGSLLLPWLPLLAFLAYFFAAFRWGLRYPFWDLPGGGDAILQGTFIKTVIETGWVIQNPRLGAPFGTSLLDFPGADGALLLIIKFFALFSSDPSVVMNLFYVSSFVLVFAAAYWVLRRLGVQPLWASTAALLYTCLPYHFLRGTQHLYLSNYFIVPLLTWTALRIYPGDGPGDRQTLPALGWREIAVLVLGGSCGVYYAFFGMIVILFMGLFGTVQERSSAYLRRAILCILIVCASVLANLAPTFAYHAKSGANAEVAGRSPMESEMYGLRVAQMLIPIWGHQNAAVAEMGRKYHSALRPITEAGAAALGVIGGTGFLALFAFALFRRPTQDRRLTVMAQTNLALFSFAAVGGFAVLFAILVTPQFRGVNRVSTYIGFLALAGLFLWLQGRPFRWQEHFARHAWLRYPAALAIMLFGIYDQMPVGARPAEPPAHSDHRKDDAAELAAFIRQVEAGLPRGAMVHVMPYLAFPESAPVFEEGYNALLRPYYYSSHVRWSAGSMRGRRGDAWLKALDALPVEDRVAALEKSGFSGIYVERRGFPDGGKELEQTLRRLASAPPLESADGSRAFYRLRPDPQPVLTPNYLLSFGPRFYTPEAAGGKRWVWSQRNGELHIRNYQEAPMEAVLTGELSSLNDRKVRVSVDGTVLGELTLPAKQAVPLSVALTLKPGMNVVTLASEEPEATSPPDTRTFAVMLMQPVLRSR